MTEGNDLILIVSIAIAALAVLVLALVLMRSSKSRRTREPILSERAKDERPYLRQAAPDVPVPAPTPAPAPAVVSSRSAGVADEISTAARNVVTDVLNVDGHDPDPGNSDGRDDLQKLKGCGPKLAARLNELGITRFAQLAGFCENEIAMLDEKLGPFRGRLARDRFAEQAAFLARGDTDGFEERFGKLGG